MNHRWIIYLLEIVMFIDFSIALFKQNGGYLPRFDPKIGPWTPQRGPPEAAPGATSFIKMGLGKYVFFVCTVENTQKYHTNP